MYFVYRLSDETGEMKFKMEKEGQMTLSDLDTKVSINHGDNHVTL